MCGQTSRHGDSTAGIPRPGRAPFRRQRAAPARRLRAAPLWRLRALPLPAALALLVALFGLLELSAPRYAHAQFNGSFSIDAVHLNRENWLDWRAYQPPTEWRQEDYRQPNALQASVGSLSQVRFFQTHELRLEKDLGAYATLLYTQNEYSLFRSNPLYQEVELRAGAAGTYGGFYGSIIGFTYPDKSLSNQGLALAWGKRTDPNTVRLSYLQEQALFDEKNFGSARYTRDPILNRVQARFFPGGNLRIDLDYRDEPEARLVSPATASVPSTRQETYRAQKFDGRADWRARDDLVLGLIVSDNTEHRQLIPDAPSPGLPAKDQTLTWGWSELNARWTLAGGDTLTFAAVDSRFENVIDSADLASAYHFRLRTTQGYALWEALHSAWFRWTFSLQVGEVRLFESASSDPVERNDSPTTQGKFGFGVILTEVRSYRMWFQSTWAPDAISGQKWDGGNVQFQLYF